MRIQKVLKLVFNYGVSFLYGLGSLLIAKRKGLYVFRLFHDPHHFSGNVKALLCYVKTAETGIKIVFLSRNKQVLEGARQLGIPTISSIGKQFLISLKAEHIIIDSYTGLYRWGSFSIIQLWHGAGYKNIGLLRDDLSDSRRKRLERIFKNYKMVVATAAGNKVKKDASFGKPIAEVTGNPRNDIFFKDNTKLLQELKLRLNLDGYARIIGYAPTFRDYRTKPPFTTDFWAVLQEELVVQDAVFIVKKHPWEELLKIPEGYDRIIDVSEQTDAEELMLVTDWLVTDYSSIATDFVLTGKPILIYAYDYEEYKRNCRSIYYDLREVLPKPFLTTESELLAVVKNPEDLESSEIKESYKRFQQEFNRYLDGYSSERVFRKIKEL